MTRIFQSIRFLFVLIALLTACKPAPQPLATATATVVMPTLSPTPLSPTATPSPTVAPTATITTDPLGLTPSQACGASEEFLYLEDFQAHRAPGWDLINEELRGWSMESAPDEPGNIVAAARYSDGVVEPISDRLLDMQVEDAVWRARFLLSQPFASQQNWLSFNWKKNLEPLEVNGQQVFDSRYQIIFGSGFQFMGRSQRPVASENIYQVQGALKAGIWHWVEIASYKDETGLWLNGARIVLYKDPEPLPPGTIGLEMWLKNSGITVYFDNISICKLSAPFESMLP